MNCSPACGEVMQRLESMLSPHKRMNSIKIPHVSMWHWNRRWSNDIYLSGRSLRSTWERREKVNKNKWGTAVSRCKGCLCHLSSFVFPLPSFPAPSLTFQLSVALKVLKVWQTKATFPASRHPSSYGCKGQTNARDANQESLNPY